MSLDEPELSNQNHSPQLSLRKGDKLRQLNLIAMMVIVDLFYAFLTIGCFVIKCVSHTF